MSNNSSSSSVSLLLYHLKKENEIELHQLAYEGLEKEECRDLHCFFKISMEIKLICYEITNYNNASTLSIIYGGTFCFSPIEYTESYIKSY